MKRLIVTMLFLLLLVTACNSGEIEPTTKTVIGDATPTETALEAVEPTETTAPTVAPEPTDTAVRPTPTEEPMMTSEPADSATGPAIIFKRSGGFAGLDDQWIIYADGRVTGALTTEDPLSTEHIARILTDAEVGGFFTLDDQYIVKGHCCDFFNYEVTLNLADGRSHTITTMEQTPNMPPVVAQVIKEINFLLFRERIQE